MNIIKKLKFLLKKPRVIIVTGSGGKPAKEAIFQVLSQHPHAGKNILISESNLKNPQDIEELKFLVRNSFLFIFVASHIEERETAQEIQRLAKIMPDSGWFVLNFDDQATKEMIDTTNLRVFTFGFQQGADFRATDININGRDARAALVAGEPVLGTNFKINYKGSIVPVWVEGDCGKEQIYAALAAGCVGTILDLNLIEISQALKNYHPTLTQKGV